MEIEFSNSACDHTSFGSGLCLSGSLAPGPERRGEGEMGGWGDEEKHRVQ